ncbi:MAG TPA: thrombospondin type 3 repeat-containing protein, partial [Gammaproteobacteria bacterium]|nr:thrombospondin type 3 repeat-containing protein [Gammaproteobacteria bacterium]
MTQAAHDSMRTYVAVLAAALLVGCGGGGGSSDEEPAPTTVSVPDDDGDGVANASDNCPAVANAGQDDLDFDSMGDACDDDIDNDGVANASDAFPNDANEQIDTDGDGVGDRADPDNDNDGVIDTQDACPLDPTDSLDFDNDGVCNMADTEPLVLSVTPSVFALYDTVVASELITVTAQIAGEDIGFLRLGAEKMSDTGPEIKTFDLYDEGTDGDSVAGDGIFTKTFAFEWTGATGLASFAEHSYYERKVYPIRIFLHLYDSSGVKLPEVSFVKETSFTIAVIDAGASATATQQSESLWTTTNIANLITEDFRFVPTQLGEVTADFCATFPDTTFDFLSVQNYDTSVHPIVGGDWAVPVSNDVDGIGMLQFDESEQYGCPDLQLVTFHDTAGLMGARITHEFGHRFNAYYSEDALRLSDFEAVSHWGHTSICDGQMTQGYCLVDQGDGTLLVEAPHAWETPIFSDLSLYAWGLLPKAEVESQWFVTNPDVPLTVGETIPQADARLVTIDDVVAQYGARVPAIGKDTYRVGFIVVSDRVLTNAEFAFESL